MLEGVPIVEVDAHSRQDEYPQPENRLDLTEEVQHFGPDRDGVLDLVFGFAQGPHPHLVFMLDLVGDVRDLARRKGVQDGQQKHKGRIEVEGIVLDAVEQDVAKSLALLDEVCIAVSVKWGGEGRSGPGSPSGQQDSRKGKHGDAEEGSQHDFLR